MFMDPTLWFFRRFVLVVLGMKFVCQLTQPLGVFFRVYFYTFIYN